MEVPILLGVLSVCLLIILLLLRNNAAKGSVDIEQFDQLRIENEQLKIKVARAEERVQSTVEERDNLKNLFKEQLNRQEEEIAVLQKQIATEKSRNAQAEEAFRAQQERLTAQKQYVDELQQRFKTEFETIAEKILKEKSREFTEVNRNSLDILLNPLKENIKAFEDKVEKVYKTESDERNVLKGEISKLMELNRQISEEANNLSRALKSDSKKQGNWGEMILDRILQASGLVEGESYKKQSGFKQEDGSRQQPDVVILLPDNKHLIIDAKVSLRAYDRLVNSDHEEERKLHLKDHLIAIRNHINGLGARNYQDLYGVNSPDFVLLFVPIESSFAVAVQNDLDLFEFAWNKRVVIVTPSTLLATLKTIASIWKQELQTRNAIDIATKAGALYDKFVGFVEDLKKVGDQIDRSQKAYGDAMNKLTTGSGNLVNRAETLRKLGARSTKQLDLRLIEED